jgi:ATP-dependent Clp protease ATP-binding subunit ClpA
VRSEDMKHSLNKCRDEHEELKTQIQELLNKYQDDGKSPNAFAKGMSWMKTNVKLAMNENDSTIADLITDGCNMGVKSLSRYLNQYAAAEEKAKDITKKLISQEEDLSVAMRDFL